MEYREQNGFDRLVKILLSIELWIHFSKVYSINRDQNRNSRNNWLLLEWREARRAITL